MSDRRAAIRREKNERMKINKHRSANGELERLVLRGTLHGRLLAVCVVGCILKEQYNFTTNKLNKLIELANKEAAKFDRIATKFNIEFYSRRMADKLSKVWIPESVRDARNQIYTMQRNQLFISSCSLMFIALNQEFGFASNSKGTGRTDLIMEYATNEYIKLQLDPEVHNVDWYAKRFEKVTGIKLERDE